MNKTSGDSAIIKLILFVWNEDDVNCRIKNLDYFCLFDFTICWLFALCFIFLVPKVYKSKSFNI